jgi:hypothetical protein
MQTIARLRIFYRSNDRKTTIKRTQSDWFFCVKNDYASYSKVVVTADRRIYSIAPFLILGEKFLKFGLDKPPKRQSN